MRGDRYGKGAVTELFVIAVLALVICVAALVGAARADVLLVDGFETTCRPPAGVELALRPRLEVFVAGRWQRASCESCTYASWLGAWPGEQGLNRVRGLAGFTAISLPVDVGDAPTTLISDETPQSVGSSFATISRCPFGWDQPAAAGCMVGGLRSWSLSVGPDPALSRCVVRGRHYLVIVNAEHARGDVLVSVRPGL